MKYSLKQNYIDVNCTFMIGFPCEVITDFYHNRIMKMAIINQKGGTGKTSTSVNLAYALARSGKKTLLIDMDPQGHACAIYQSSPVAEEPTIKTVLVERRFDIRDAINTAEVSGKKVSKLFIISSNIHLEKGGREIYNRAHREKILHNQLKKIESEYEFILIDCPPRLNQLTVNSIYTADLLLIPVVLDRYSLDGVADLFDTIEEVKEGELGNFLILRNAFDMREKISNNIAETILSDYKDHLCRATIRRASVMKQAQQFNQPVFTYDPKSTICEDFISLSHELIKYAKKE